MFQYTNVVTLMLVCWWNEATFALLLLVTLSSVQFCQQLSPFFSFENLQLFCVFPKPELNLRVQSQRWVWPLACKLAEYTASLRESEFCLKFIFINFIFVDVVFCYESRYINGCHITAVWFQLSSCGKLLCHYDCGGQLQSALALLMLTYWPDNMSVTFHIRAVPAV